MVNPTPPIEVKGLCYHSRGRVVLQEISFSVGEGEIVALVGPNQSGKSALVRILAGQVVPSGGEARVLGCIPWDEPYRLQRQTGYLPEQDLAGGPDARVIDYLLLAARLKEIPRGKRTRMIERAAEEARVSQLLGRRLDDLPRGERRRVFLAQVLIGSPRVLLLDSPFEGLDARAAEDLSWLLRQKSKGRALLLATTRLGEAAEVADRLLILSGGRVAASGTPREIAQRFGAGSGREAIRLKPPVEGAREEMVKALLGLAGVDEVLSEEQPDGTLLLTVLARRKVRGEAVALLVARGAEVLEVREVEGFLSGAYQALTAGEGG